MKVAIRFQEDPPLALRLSTPKSSAPIQPTRVAERLAARAQSALFARDYKAYREVFAETSEIEDVHRRYQARKALIDQGMAAAGNAGQDVAQLFLNVARAVASLLDENPREPYFLNYLGVALYELGQLDAAAQLFRAALRLDDTVPFVEGNLREIARRRRERRDVPIAQGIRAALQPVLARAKDACKNAKRVDAHKI